MLISLAKKVIVFCCLIIVAMLICKGFLFSKKIVELNDMPPMTSNDICEDEENLGEIVAVNLAIVMKPNSPGRDPVYSLYARLYVLLLSPENKCALRHRLAYYRDKFL